MWAGLQPSPLWACCSEEASLEACRHGPLPFYPGQSSSESLCIQKTRESWEEAGPGSAGLGQRLIFPKTMPQGTSMLLVGGTLEWQGSVLPHHPQNLAKQEGSILPSRLMEMLPLFIYSFLVPADFSSRCVSAETPTPLPVAAQDTSKLRA